MWLSLAGALGVHATVMMALDLETLAQQADMVIRAQVLATQAKIEGTQARILTEVELNALECWKGTCPEVVTALVAGGQQGDIEQRLSGSAQFAPGEECVVFLKAHGKTRFKVLGMAQGKYRLEWKEDLSEPVVAPEEMKDVELIYSDAQRMVMPLRREMPLSVFRKSVLSSLQSPEVERTP